jgi:type I restriction enzyme, R subunit
LHLEERENEETGRVTRSLIFPRYHQLDCVRKLLREVRAKGTGDNYLIQHSAGSGKSNTIAWLAHQLANFFTDDNELIFDSVIIITDRQVLDKQLQETVKQFEKTAGLVQKIDKNTKQLVAALAGGAKIIVCTLQKFSWMRNVLNGPKALKGKKFALIVDEAHSSQSGEGAKDLKLVLTTPEALKAIIAEDEENKEWTDPVAEELSQIMKGRQRLPHLSFFAFTATPKTKTLEVFGDALQIVTPEGVKKVGHKPFHTYTMRQAIEEGFILDVLQSYTTYSTYFELLENEKAPPGYEVETAKGRRLLMKHVGKHPHTIESKAKIMLDHFFSKTVNKIGGEAKAMVVTSSRAHAVLYKQTFDRLLREDYAGQAHTLVAFSGKVSIKGHDEPYTEEEMNPRDAKNIREAFKKQKYRILIVANKFQTGFDHGTRKDQRSGRRVSVLRRIAHHARYFLGVVQQRVRHALALLHYAARTPSRVWAFHAGGPLAHRVRAPCLHQGAGDQAHCVHYVACISSARVSGFAGSALAAYEILSRHV